MRSGEFFNSGHFFSILLQISPNFPAQNDFHRRIHSRGARCMHISGQPMFSACNLHGEASLRWWVHRRLVGCRTKVCQQILERLGTKKPCSHRVSARKSDLLG